MPIPSAKGQYRYVQYEDDGVCRYQCLWCLNSIMIYDNPDYGWNFCPKCGKSWFKRLECRDHNTPRWAYDRWGNHPPHTVELHGPYRKDKSHWVFEYRTKWPGEEWGEWQHERTMQKSWWKPDYTEAYRHLLYLRGRNEPSYPGEIEFEYRVRLEQNHDFRFVIPNMQKTPSFEEFCEKYLTS